MEPSRHSFGRKSEANGIPKRIEPKVPWTAPQPAAALPMQPCCEASERQHYRTLWGDECESTLRSEASCLPAHGRLR